MHSCRSRPYHSILRGPLTHHQPMSLRAAMEQSNNNKVKAGAASEHARIASSMPVFAPTLRSVDPVQVAKCFKERDRYKLDMKSKKAEVPSLQVTPYKVSVGQSLLKHLSFMGCFDDFAPDVTFEGHTSENIEAYLRTLVKNTDHNYYPTHLRDALAGLKFPAGIGDPSARKAICCADIFDRLDTIWYGDIRIDNPKHTIHLLLVRLKPQALKPAMFLSLKVEAGLE